ncbi:MAG: aryl-sulfate sulfotransferase [Lewinellaceae bacterium]|nr:aryl-sulfate sulfotransferase [Lewinellaceae bacterium]
MTKNLLRVAAFTLGSIYCLHAQNTVGLLSYNPYKSFDGYNLMYPHNQPNVYLLDNCGEIVHVWPDSGIYRPGNTAYLLPNCNLVKTKRLASVAGNPIWTGGGGAIIEMRDWDNMLLWQFERNDANYRLHHDIEVMPNGHILAIQWEAKTVAECLAAGRDSNLLTSGVLWPDGVIEIDPATGQVVWEWHVWDHLVQDFDATKANFGVVGDHPELVDFNFGLSSNGASWMHTNAIDYQPDNDLILISVPTFSEVWVIDHSTTTAQAAGHFGGFGGRGGDLLYRWGNPQAYRAGTAADQKLFFQHDPHWALDFLTPNHPQFGKIAVFNNRAGADYSSVNVFNPGFDMYSWAFPFANGMYGPTDFDVTITHPNPQLMYSTGLSSVQVLPNGNYLICSGQSGYSFEITPAGEIAWEYVTPLRNGAPATQGDSIALTQNNTFRMNRYPVAYAAFTGKDLSGKGWIELNPDSTLCATILPTNNLPDAYGLKLYPNPATDMVTIEWQQGMYVLVEIFDLLGRRKAALRLNGGREYLDVADWQAGLYFVVINGKEVRKLVLER